MSSTSPVARRGGKGTKPAHCRARAARTRMVRPEPLSGLAVGTGHSRVDLGDCTRVALMVTPQGRGSLAEQVREVVAAMQIILHRQPEPMTATVLTVFLRNAGDQAECEQLFLAIWGPSLPVINYVMQPPCCGAALAVEGWAIAGKSVCVKRLGPNVLTVAYDRVRWVYCAGLTPGATVPGVYRQTSDVLARSRVALAQAGSSFESVVRTWFYLGGITEMDGKAERYQELNRARTDFYRDIHFHYATRGANGRGGVYPASTGIGMSGRGLVMTCMALETERDDLALVTLENPLQTPAYAYDRKYSPESPKFSRAVALSLGHYVTTWVSGTASIVDSESCHPGDPERQTEQTIDNIERLIAPENFARHGLKGSGADLRDLAKIRVYLKRPEDLPKCKAICERRFGKMPAIYAVAGICRPELLVEIEGVAFSRHPI